jgi:microcystin-dependent protein
MRTKHSLIIMGAIILLGTTCPISAQPTDAVPIGTVVMYAGYDPKIIPDGWLLCDGRGLVISEYPELYSVIQLSFGGSRTDSFYLPDCRGMFIRGVDGERGKDPDKLSRTYQSPGGNTGNSVGSVESDAIRLHSHDIAKVKGTKSLTATTVLDTNYVKIWTKPADWKTVTYGGKETRPVNLYLYYIIRFK